VNARLYNDLKGESGYSLVEVLVAILLLSLAIIPMVSMFDAGLRSAVLGGNYDKARALANANLEEVKAGGYAEAESLSECPSDTDGSTPDGFSCDLETERARVEDGEIETGGGSMLQVTVTVEWDGGSNDYETSAIISPGGF